MSFCLSKHILGYYPPKIKLPKPASLCLKQCSGEKGSGVRGFRLHTIFECLDDSSAFRRVLNITNLEEISSTVEKAKERQKPFCGA